MVENPSSPRSLYRPFAFQYLVQTRSTLPDTPSRFLRITNRRCNGCVCPSFVPSPVPDPRCTLPHPFGNRPGYYPETRLLAPSAGPQTRAGSHDVCDTFTAPSLRHRPFYCPPCFSGSGRAFLSLSLSLRYEHPTNPTHLRPLSRPPLISPIAITPRLFPDCLHLRLLRVAVQVP
jgi:hypothetical protein